MNTPWTRDALEVARDLGVDPAHGLADAEAAQRLRRDGPNRLAAVRPRSLAAILWAQLRSLLVGLLAVAAGVGFLSGDRVEAIAILAVIALNTAIGFFSELRAVRSMEALRRLGVTTCRVRRGGRLEELSADALVAGDIVLLEGGDVVPADLRVLEAARVQVDESALTGESVPVDKAAGDAVFAGTVNGEGALLIEVTKLAREFRVPPLAILAAPPGQLFPGWFPLAIGVVVMLASKPIHKLMAGVD